MERVVDDLAVQGYKIKARSEESAVLDKPEYGTVGIHILLLIFTAGIGNIIYALVKFGGRDKVMVKVDLASSAGQPAAPMAPVAPALEPSTDPSELTS